MKNVSQLTNFVQNKLSEYTQTTTRTADVGIVFLFIFLDKFFGILKIFLSIQNFI